MYIDCPADNTKYDVLCKLYGLMTIGQFVIFVKVCGKAISRDLMLTDR